MSVSKTQPEAAIAIEQEQLAWLFAGCASLRSEGGWADAAEAYANGIDFGERNIWQQVEDPENPGTWIKYAERDQMPLVQISSNRFEQTLAAGDCSFDTSGLLAAHIYMAPSLDSAHRWHGPNFFGTLLQELWGQKNQLNTEPPDLPGLTLPFDRIEVIGPTRTSIFDRGHDGRYDYFDAVFMFSLEVH